MATSIFFGGRRINIPGAYSEIDTSALSSISPSAVGIVALIGTAEGGEPLTVDESVSDMTRAAEVFDKFRSGDLRTASLFAFEPSTDPAVPNGAQRVVALKVNPSTQSTLTLVDDDASDAVDLTSADWGLFTAQINIEVANGTNQGKLITIVFEDTTETLDDVGGDAALDVDYAAVSDGWDLVNARMKSTGLELYGGKIDTGLLAQRTNDIPAPGVIDVVSSAAGDTTQSITIFGLNASSAPISETIALNGVTNVQGSTAFTKVLACQLDAATAGTVTVSDFPVVTTLFTLAPATLTRGMLVLDSMPMAGTITMAIDVDTAVDVVIRGENAAGAAVAERFDMTAGATTPVVGTVQFARITAAELGDVAGARSIFYADPAGDGTLSVNVDFSLYTTVQRAVDYINTRDGFTATALASNATTLATTDLDFEDPSDPQTAIFPGGPVEFFADLNAFIAAINAGSGLIDAARATGARKVPANTASALFLAGGVEGTTTITQWQEAFNLLRSRRVTTIVPLTRDPAVHALLATHLIERAGRLRSEANGYVGIATAGGAGETLANIRSQIQVLGTRHVSALSQEMQRFDPDTGDATWYPPHFFGTIAAGMQAGSPIGEPLTRKRPLVTDIRNDSSWSVENDTETLIDAGAMIAEKVDNVGIRFVRSVTTYLADDNVVFSEMSANESANTAVFEFRRALELKIGQRGLSGTVNAIKGLANDVLGRLVDDDIIVAYRSLQVEQVGDVFPVSCEIAPVLPINFIPITVHLVAVRAAA
jgi:hypothetical protein